MLCATNKTGGNSGGTVTSFFIMQIIKMHDARSPQPPGARRHSFSLHAIEILHCNSVKTFFEERPPSFHKLCGGYCVENSQTVLNFYRPEPIIFKLSLKFNIHSLKEKRR